MAVYMPSKDITTQIFLQQASTSFGNNLLHALLLAISLGDDDFQYFSAHLPNWEAHQFWPRAAWPLMPRSQMFAGASNFEIRNSILTTGNVTYHGAPQAANYGHVSISVSNVLQCPSPSQYFVGREDILEKLSKIFSAPVDFVRQNLKYSSSIFLDASSSQTLDKSIAENITQVTSGNTLLVLQNPSAPVEEYLDRLPYAPVLAITTESSVESSTASSSLTMQFNK
ncbi:hypothetical protein BT96DRAFT_982079 [Gymnopus androsaceus JB14]|uniref:Uncharacterized protein n=1 Tax=Gymnopus androsaceus JB14 TaxID=1447944 RepID=A0A6A4GI21_9AGAR|nr:hypothetical protein BT96DRAFT_982079 [Gymnopus androsaceus JB14]